MESEMLIVFAVAAVAGLLMVSGKARLDIVAVLAVLALILCDVLTVPEAFAGFGNPVIAMVAGLLVISEMLARTGVAQHLGKWITRYGKGHEVRLLVILMLVVPVLGSFMSNTAVVAIFIPVALSIAKKTDLNASRLLMPLAYAGLASGMLTLIATPSNLVVSELLDEAGYGPFSFFSFTPIGLSVLVVLIVYMVFAGRRLLPGAAISPPKTNDRSMKDLLLEYEVSGTANRLKVPADSPLIGKNLTDSKIGSEHDGWVIMIEHAGIFGAGITAAPSPQIRVRNGDVLVVRSSQESAVAIAERYGLALLKVSDSDREKWMQEAGIAKVLIHPESKLIGQTFRKIGLLRGYGVQVLGMRRKHEVVEAFLDERIKNGDTVLVTGPWNRIQRLQAELHDFVVLELPTEIEWVPPAWERAPAALAIVALMVGLAVSGIVPVVVAVIICALLAVFTRCLTMEEVYRSIHWSTLVLIGGIMSIALAMTQTGAIDLVSGALVSGMGETGPYLMLAALFILTVAMSMVLTSSAGAILCTPIAIAAAEASGVAPQAFAMAVAIAASSGFVVPVSSAAVMLVMGPGKYRLLDFVKVGAPMLLLTLIVVLILVPLLFPF